MLTQGLQPPNFDVPPAFLPLRSWSSLLNHRLQENFVATPALLTGTSAEFIGKRHLPRILRERCTHFVLGPDGSGKTRVAERIAKHWSKRPIHLDCRSLQDALLERVKQRRWSRRLRQARALVLDGPVWLRNRPAVVEALVELIEDRRQYGWPTTICQVDLDGSVDAVMARLETGSFVVVGLRFPTGARGRLRFARRMCKDLGISTQAARGTDQLDPWHYRAVLDDLHAWAFEHS